MISEELRKSKNLKTDVVNVFSYAERWGESLAQNLQWIREGKLKYRETVTKGFENLIVAFNGLFYGANIGKAIVRV